jgi:hypothetical protein
MQDEIESAVASGAITEFHPAFSHEQKELVFVQHKLLENKESVWDLVANKGAYVYVCGYVELDTLRLHWTSACSHLVVPCWGIGSQSRTHDGQGRVYRVSDDCQGSWRQERLRRGSVFETAGIQRPLPAGYLLEPVHQDLDQMFCDCLRLLGCARAGTIVCTSCAKI